VQNPFSALCWDIGLVGLRIIIWRGLGDEGGEVAVSIERADHDAHSRDRLRFGAIYQKRAACDLYVSGE
jgi:hypothetical protein